MSPVSDRRVLTKSLPFFWFTELPPASALSSRTSLLVVLFDVCERGALEGVLRLPCRPAHRPLLVANGIDCEYWRVVQGNCHNHSSPIAT